jgi:Ca2+-binding EF-hand superfamily protein
MSIGAIGGVGSGYDSQSIAQMRQNMFTMMDEDGDGVISASECQTAATNMSQATGLSVSADEMMSIFDLNGDGSITQAEQTEASPAWEQHMASLMEESGMRPMGPPPPPPDQSSEMSDLMDQIFSAMDTDGDGVISKTEYEAAMEQLGGQSDSTTASSSESDSSTSTTSTTASTDTTDATSSTEETSLSSLLAQFLELLAKMEQDSYSQYSQESQSYLGMNSYA